MYDIYIIQKQTTLERYTKNTNEFDFFNYLERDKQSPEALYDAHATHEKSRHILLNCLNKFSLSYKIYNLDEIRYDQVSFFNETNLHSGLRPQKKLVISLGGDGTLLHASHYVGGDIELLGMNSAPKYSVGHMCPVTPDKIQTAIEAFAQKKYNTQAVRRLKFQLSNGQTLPLALNDVLVCNKHPAATSRYQISIYSRDEMHEIESEKQLSSGIWIASPAGSTAAISPYGFPQVDVTSSDILVAVREPYTPRNEILKLKQFILNSDEKILVFFSRMRQGLACVDGPDSCATLGFGDTMRICAPKECELRLVGF